MKEKIYLPRIIENQIDLKLKTSGAVLVKGPKFCGKTTTCKRFAKSEISLKFVTTKDLVKLDPNNALIGENPHLIDEWQIVPDIFNYVRASVDDKSEFGLYILTGSATPADKKDLLHSGAGRIVPINMSSMTLSETKESRKLVSISNLFSNSQKDVFDLNENYSLNDTLFFMCRGGWPESVLASKEYQIQVTTNYCESLFEFNETTNEEYKNINKSTLKALIKSYSRNVSTEASNITLIQDIKTNEFKNISTMTLAKYLKILQDLFIINDIKARSPNLRSSTAIRTTNTRHLVDTSLAIHFLELDQEGLKTDLNLLGLLFEDFVVHELKVYIEHLGGDIFHYRDKNDLECDAVLKSKNNKFGLIEIKLGGKENISKAKTSINKLESKLSDKTKKNLVFKMIITSFGPLYKDEDFYIVPINCLYE